MFDFEWRVDTAGYEWILDPEVSTLLTRGLGGWRLAARGGALRSYRPFDCPDLARRFARLPLGREAARGFADEWGLLDDRAGARLTVISARRRRLAALFLQLDWPAAPDHLISGTECAASAFGVLQQPPLRLCLTEGPAPRLTIAPASLWGTLLVLAAQEIAGVVAIATCLNCGEPIAVGPGQGATRRRKFCSDPCRGAWHHRRPSTED